MSNLKLKQRVKDILSEANEKLWQEGIVLIRIDYKEIGNKKLLIPIGKIQTPFSAIELNKEIDAK